MTPAMRAELHRLTDAMPASYARRGFPGLPAGQLDMRSIAALERRGFVESVVHRWRSRYDHEDNVVLVYRATPAGRAATDLPAEASLGRNDPYPLEPGGDDDGLRTFPVV